MIDGDHMTAPHQIAFVPLPGNHRFNEGEGVSIEYRALLSIDFKIDFSELGINFSYCRITLRGDELEELFHLIRAHEIDQVHQVGRDAPASDPLPYRVTSMAFD